MTDTQIVDFIERAGMQSVLLILGKAQTFCSLGEYPSPTFREAFAIAVQLEWIQVPQAK